MSWLNYGLSKIWSEANRAARWGRDHRWIHAVHLPVRTIGVGNLQAGGSGKTPLVIQIAREAAMHGLQVGILTRGSRSEWERTGGIIRPSDVEPSPKLCGDEAALIHDQVPQAWIGIGANRVKQFQAMSTEVREASGGPFDLIILDDAFQHWRIHCDQYLIAITNAQFGDRVFRDEYRSVRPHDFLVLTKGSEFPEALKNHPRKTRVEFQLPPADPVKKYRFVTAIGDPEHARATLETAGYRIGKVDIFPDHYPFEVEEINRLLEEANAGNDRILLTGKDWVKWRAHGISLSSVDVVEPELKMLEGKSLWDRVLWDAAPKGTPDP